MVSFVCNICGQANTVTVLKHEESSCGGCGSNVRLRALVYLLGAELFGDEFLLERGAEVCLFRTPVTADYLAISKLITDSRYDEFDQFVDPRISRFTRVSE